jgi:hypothetical protein
MSTTTTPPTGSKGSLQLDLFQTESLTGAASRTSAAATSPDLRSVTFLPASVDGPRLSGVSDGGMTGRLGPQACLANRSQGSVSKKVLPILDTSGRYSSDLSPSDVLQSSLESNLQMRLRGSQMCAVVWVTWVTPWGPSLSKPLARVRSIGGHDTTLWPTVTTSRGGSNSESKAVRLNGHGTNLTGALWGTLRVSTNGGRGSPTAPDKSRIEDQVQATVLNGCSITKVKRGALHPEFACWLMAYPERWLGAIPKVKPPSTRALQRLKDSETH